MYFWKCWRDSRWGFMAVALVNLAFTSIHAVEALMDWGGPGPMPAHTELVNAQLFAPPLGAPLQMPADGLGPMAQPPPGQPK